jgi:hypothetical protein
VPAPSTGVDIVATCPCGVIVPGIGTMASASQSRRWPSGVAVRWAGLPVASIRAPRARPPSHRDCPPLRSVTPSGPLRRQAGRRAPNLASFTETGAGGEPESEVSSGRMADGDDAREVERMG